MSNKLQPVIKVNASKARSLILTVSAVVLLVVVLMGKYKPLVDVVFPFDRYIFARINGVINSMVSILLVVAVWQAKAKNFLAHKKLMLAAIALSALFLVFYIVHHISNPDTHYAGTGIVKGIYLFLLLTHIVLAAVILPFILFVSYYALSGQYAAHKKMARYTFPLWLYVSVTGVIVFMFINPYYPAV